MNIRTRCFAYGCLAAFALLPLGCAPADPDTPAPPASAPAAALVIDETLLPTGGALYAEHCATCHGTTGHGDGPLGKLLKPPPRSLVSDPYQYLDTATPDTLRSSLVALLRKGMPEKAMPGLEGKVTDKEMAQVAEFVLSLRE